MFNLFIHSFRWALAIAKIRIRLHTVHGTHPQRRRHRMRNMQSHHQNRSFTSKQRQMVVVPWQRHMKVKRCWLVQVAVVPLTYQPFHDQINWKYRVARKRVRPIYKWKFHRQTRNIAVSHWPDHRLPSSVNRYANVLPMVRTVYPSPVSIWMSSSNGMCQQIGLREFSFC